MRVGDELPFVIGLVYRFPMRTSMAEELKAKSLIKAVPPPPKAIEMIRDIRESDWLRSKKAASR